MNISEMAVSIAKVNYCLYLECSHALDKYNKNPWADHRVLARKKKKGGGWVVTK